MRYCKKCGAQMRDDAKFCPTCGAGSEDDKQPGAGRQKTPSGKNKQKPEQGNESRKAPKKKSAAPFIALCLVLIIAMAGGTGYFVWNMKKGDAPVSQEDDVWGTPKPDHDEESVADEAPETTEESQAVTEAQTEAAAAATAPAETEIPTTAYAATTAPETAAVQYETMYVVNCEEFITLRPGDSTTSGEICKIPLGASVSFVSAAGNGFYQIMYNGYTGYALSSYLSTQPAPAAQATTAAYVYKTMYVVNCKESITLRTSDSTSASEICQIPLGASVSYVSAAGNGFYQIIYNGKTGYALASYLSE